MATTLHIKMRKWIYCGKTFYNPIRLLGVDPFDLKRVQVRLNFDRKQLGTHFYFPDLQIFSFSLYLYKNHYFKVDSISPAAVMIAAFLLSTVLLAIVLLCLPENWTNRLCRADPFQYQRVRKRNTEERVVNSWVDIYLIYEIFIVNYLFEFSCLFQLSMLIKFQLNCLRIIFFVMIINNNRTW